MKKILTLVATSVILMSLFTGCGSQNTSTQTSSTTTQSSSSSTKNNQNMKMPDLAGEVTAINGSQVTLKLIELPAASQDKNGKAQDGQSTNSSTSSSSQNSQQSGQKPDGNPPSDQGGQKTTGNQSNGQSPKMEVKYTGETKTITIADGVSITSLSMGQNGGTEKTIAVKDIKVGDRLDISYSDSNKTTISKISVRGSSQASTQGQTQTQSQN